MALEDGYAQAIFGIARSEGQLEELEDELFQVARGIEGSTELRDTLSDRRIPVERRMGIIEELIAGKATRLTLALVEFLVAAERIRELPRIADEFVALAAAERQKAVAEVRSAVPLDTEMVDRLTEALGRATEKEVEVKIVVDPSIVGGVVARIGDTVIDGSIRSRLVGLRQALR
ncbi:MAG: ATP synthase F1 subunit delta [Acidimicrobiia bacterium]